MIDSHEILRAAAAGIGVSDAASIAVGTRSTLDGEHKVGLFEVRDHPQPGVTTWGTVGMSFLDNRVTTRDDRVLRVELVCAVGRTWERAGDGLASCALALASGESCTPDSVFREPFAAASTSTPHAIFVPPFIWGPFVTLSDESSVVTWLQAVAVTPEEAEFAVAHGVEALTDLFEAQQPDIFDFARASVILP